MADGIENCFAPKWIKPDQATATQALVRRFRDFEWPNAFDHMIGEEDAEALGGLGARGL